MSSIENRRPWRSIMISSIFLAGSLLLPGSSIAGQDPSLISDLFVVDCLLPGQLRQLGQRTTYLSARRPIKTTAADCRIRGGEYAAYDRASYRTSLNVWLPKAKDGDAEARTNVGEIFEKGLGATPDYATAAQWYRLAAEDGHTRAQINLGHLYEMGLGVEANPIQALEWYRRASGLADAIALEPDDAQSDRGVELLSMRRQIEALKQQSDELRDELETTHRRLEESTGADSPQPDPVFLPATGDEQSGSAEQALDSLRVDIQQRTDEATQLAALLDSLQEKVEFARSELHDTTAEQGRRIGELGDTGAQLEAIRLQAESKQLELSGLEDELQQRQTRLEAQRAAISLLADEMTRLDAETSRRREQLEKLQSQEQVLEQRVLAGPAIALIEPLLSTTRGVAVVGVPTQTDRRQIVGRVTAPAGLLTLTINEIRAEPNSRGVFSAEVAVRAPSTPVGIVAVDQQGKRVAVNFMLETKPTVEAVTRESASRHDDFPDFGDYYALVIGNNDYQYLPKLKTALNDANAISDVLSKKYGFRTRTLLNVTRYEILSALNELREQLTSQDNLLVYYAGHGDLDRVNQRGHWLPVDAELDNSANWLSNVAVTDILNIMKAKQVLLVVDSCYSGTLTRSSLVRLKTGMTRSERSNWLQTMSTKRSRTVFTSGGLAPVLDAGGGAHSVFARSLLEVLRANEDLIDGQQLYREVAARVTYAAANLQFEQVPQYAPIRHAGHETGDFFFTPQL